jgi:photosystem II stability/assembly factor-like uncharacterized protein
MSGRWRRFARLVGVGVPAVLLAGAVLGAPKKTDAPTLTPQDSGTTEQLFAVSPVNDLVVWASGSGGTYLLTTDGGENWESHVVPGAEDLQFRDVEGVSADVAYLMSAGTGEVSRIYKTEDGGATWTLQVQNTDEFGFYDCFAFWNSTQGLLMADSVNDRLPVLRTLDGETWQDIGDNLPPAVPGGEFAFASSGTCVATYGKKWAWIGTNARILATTDQGDTWSAYESPIPPGPNGTGGVFSVDFRNSARGVVGGGDFLESNIVTNFARSHDGGKTWELGTDAPIPGAIFGLSYVGTPGFPRYIVATGPGGAAWTPDEGDTWNLLEDVEGQWAVAFASPAAGWLVGTGGQIIKVSF